MTAIIPLSQEAFMLQMEIQRLENIIHYGRYSNLDPVKLRADQKELEIKLSQIKSQNNYETNH